jgi:trehalose utilization protein
MKPSSLAVLFCLFAPMVACAAEPIRVLVWDEQQPAQKQAYENFLGNEIAAYLSKKPDLQVTASKIDDPAQGISEEQLQGHDIIVWWGHVRHREIPVKTGQRIVKQIQEGKVSLIALHSAHWSVPFVEAMNQRTIDDALGSLTEEQRKTAKIETITPPQYKAPARDAKRTPNVEKSVGADGVVTLKIELPNCCFPAYRPDGKPSHVQVLKLDHPLAAGLPAKFDIPHTEMYDDPFHVPKPDLVMFQETWDAGESFRSGSVWNLGKGKVFYFRPGHETFGVYHQPETLRVVENAVRWLAEEQRP